jgi:hypothetical protein
MQDIFARLSRPYCRLKNAERLFLAKYDLSPFELAALYIIRSLDLMQTGDADASAVKHLELCDRFRELMVHLARQGNTLQEFMAHRDMIEIVDSILEKAKEHDGPVQ